MDRSRQEDAHLLDACIKCSVCTAECPVAIAFPEFPGPKALGPDRERFRLERFLGDEEVLEYCSNCKTCELTCPSGVRITEIIKAARKRSTGAAKAYADWDQMGYLGKRHILGKHPAKEHPRKASGVFTAKYRLRNRLLGRAEYLSRAASLFAPLSNVVLGLKPARRLLQTALGLSAEAPFPHYGRRFRRRSSHRFQDDTNSSLKTDSGAYPLTYLETRKQVVYFPGCLVTYNESHVGEAVVKVLEHNGYEVIVPEFHCCGVPLEANGYYAEAEENAQYNLALAHPYLEKGLRVVASCSSCGLALKENYPTLKVPAAERIGLQTDDLFEFLWTLYEKGELRTDFRPLPLSLAYHAPCHLKAQGIGIPAVRLLRLIPGVHIEELDAGCCGMSGSYGFKEEKHDISLKIGEPLFSRVHAGLTAGEFQKVVSECGSCRMQIEHGSKASTLHPVEIFSAAYSRK